MKVYVVERVNVKHIPGWCETVSAVVVAEDALHAERRARWEIEDFKRCKLAVREVSLEEEQVLATEYIGDD